MPQFTYHGDGRYYPELGLEVSDGDSRELDEAPDDGRWTAPSSTGSPAAAPALAQPPAVQAPQTPAAPETTKE